MSSQLTAAKFHDFPGLLSVLGVRRNLNFLGEATVSLFPTGQSFACWLQILASLRLLLAVAGGDCVFPAFPNLAVLASCSRTFSSLNRAADSA